MIIDEVFFIKSEKNNCERIYFNKSGDWIELKSLGYIFEKLL